jgi:hypothetical protein
MKFPKLFYRASHRVTLNFIFRNHACACFESSLFKTGYPARGLSPFLHSVCTGKTLERIYTCIETISRERLDLKRLL